MATGIALLVALSLYLRVTILDNDYLCLGNNPMVGATAAVAVTNAICPIVVGKKNWLFRDTPNGAQASKVIFTALETARANGLNREKYISHLMTVLPDRFAHDPKPQIDDLLPWAEGTLPSVVLFI